MKFDLSDELNKSEQNLKHIQNIINTEIHKYKAIIEKEYKQLNEETLAELKIMKRVPYRSNNDKKNKLKNLEANFDKVIIDTAKCEIVCYNKANKGIKKVI